MRAVRYIHDGKLIWWDAPDPDDEIDFDSIAVGEEEIPEGAELIYLDCTPEEFERELKLDCGSAETGTPYLNDDVDDATGITREHDKPGRAVGRGERRRVRAYAPANPVTELMQELGKNSRQSVSWGEVARIMEMLNGER